ncbi:MAG: hypothetical protein JO098_08270 [Candidatus Eremiobacteraeota bacterium]|nr:hypothetical protein [Candidatus Eremiobacteraeota bacterium]
MNLQQIFKMPAIALIAVSAAAVIAAACGGGGSSVGGGGGTRCAQQYGGGGSSGSGACPPASPTPAASAAAVGIDLTGETPQSTTSDGTVLGFFNGTKANTPNGSEVVVLTAATNVQFHNVDPTQPHTASFLGAYTGSYPTSFTNTNGPTASAAGVSISSPNFSAGNINPGAVSAVYNTGGAGVFVFGCAYHYLSNNMRTVIMVE